jgi:hypothetical protein
MKQVLIITIFAISSLHLNAQQTAVEQDVRQLLELTGAAKLGIQAMEMMITQFQQGAPDAPNEFWTEFKKEIKPESLVNLLVPIYKKHFTQAEIKQLIAFYQTPIGKKVTATLPAVTQESMVAGQQWGQQIGAKVVQQLQEKGYIKN